MHIKHLVALRANKIHTSSLVLMTIVQQLNDKTKSAYVGEISSTYAEHDPDNYTYGGIYSLLRQLVKRGLVYVEKDEQHYNMYKLTTSGFDLVHKHL